MKVLIIGTFEVDGQEDTGIFIRATEEELKEYRHLYAEDVILEEKNLKNSYIPRMNKLQ